MESNVRFMIRAYIRMAEFSEGYEREEYINLARDLMEQIPINGDVSLKREECERWIMEYLKDGEERRVSEFKKSAINYGWSIATLTRATKVLEDKKQIARRQEGFGQHKKWYIRLL